MTSSHTINYIDAHVHKLIDWIAIAKYDFLIIIVFKSGTIYKFALDQLSHRLTVFSKP